MQALHQIMVPEELREAAGEASPGPAAGIHDDVSPLEPALVGEVVFEHLPGAGPGQVVHHNLHPSHVSKLC